ncbi:MAG: hypothetical protein JST00_32485 [Deltaproteobacteria bacterium]|nr:hypothetical protein [Deltaproteobacteria bacterium]
MLCVRRCFDARAFEFRIGSSLGITKRHRVVAASLDGDCVLDPSLMPHEVDPRRPYLVVVLDGALHLRRRGEAMERGSAIFCKSRSWLNEHERMVALGGYRAIMLHVDRALLPSPRATKVHRLARGALAISATLHDALASGAPSRDIERAQDAFVDAMRRSGIPMPARELLRQAVPTEDTHLSLALGSSLSMVAGNPAIVDVTSVLSLAERTARRRLARIADDYGLAYPRWQTLRQKWRLAVAALMLTLPDATPEGVRSEVAFASTATLCHALRREGLPSPRVIQQRAEAVRRALGGASGASLPHRR